MKTKKLMKLLMAAPGISRNQARELVAGAREYGISNEEAFEAIVLLMLDYVTNVLDGIQVEGGDEV